MHHATVDPVAVDPVAVELVRPLDVIREDIAETATAFDCALEEWWLGTQSDAVWDRICALRAELAELHEEIAGQPMP